MKRLENFIAITGFSCLQRRTKSTIRNVILKSIFTIVLLGAISTTVSSQTGSIGAAAEEGSIEAAPGPVASSEGITGTSPAEYGKSYTYTFNFAPAYAKDADGNLLEDGYVINKWNVYVSFNATNQVQAFIRKPGSTTYSQNSYSAAGNINNFNLEVQWGDFHNLDQSTIEAAVDGYYTKSGSKTRNFSKTYTKDVSLKRICTPALVSDIVLNCCTSNFKVTNINGTNNGCHENNYNWSVSGGTIISGQGTKEVTIKPGNTGNIAVTCTVKRNEANTAYSRTSSITIVRQARSANFSVRPDFLCKGSGSQFKIEDQCGLINVAWNVPVANSLNNGREVTIIPNSSIPDGSSITITATVNFDGGCSVQISRTLVVYSAATPPTPQGTVYLYPISGNVCQPDGYEATFIPSPPFANGTITIYPKILPPHDDGRPRYFKVCYINPCSGISSCAYIWGYPPSPCGMEKIGNFDGNQSFSINIFPTISGGLYNIELNQAEEQVTTVTVMNISGQVVATEQLKAAGMHRLDITGNAPGMYIVRVQNEDQVELKKIVLQ